MKMMRHILGAFLILVLGGCDGEEQKVPRQKPFVTYNENPVVAYCGADCAQCHQSQEECLHLLKENLPTFCDNKKQNCYDLWVRYAESCRSVCSNR